MEVPQAPGLGIDLNLDVIERFRAPVEAAVSTNTLH
jgi:hypothetical protein